MPEHVGPNPPELRPLTAKRTLTACRVSGVSRSERKSQGSERGYFMRALVSKRITLKD
ncbi:MAG TPA: hypothetical protein VG758_29390 [Hyphomicrobiaceae bacterium]|nr:hypothetical protein [Hyphomicrobiaceae bacterium]